MIGIDDPDVDVEVIELLWGFYRELGPRRALLVNYGRCRDAQAAQVLLASARRRCSARWRAEANLLRILDSKRSDWITCSSAQLGEYLTDASAAHFERAKGCRPSGSRSRLSRLVRGFDYYGHGVRAGERGARRLRRTSFRRWRSLRPPGGGDMARPLSIGFVPASNAWFAVTRKGCCRCLAAHSTFVIDLVGVADTARLLAELRESGLAADRAYGGRSGKRQFTAADRSGARWAVIIGADEVKRGMVAVKFLRSDQPQCEVRREEIAAWLRTRKDEAPS